MYHVKTAQVLYFSSGGATDKYVNISTHDGASCERVKADIFLALSLL